MPLTSDATQIPPPPAGPQSATAPPADTSSAPPAAMIDFSLNRLYYRSASPRPALRVALLVDGQHLAHYQRRVVEDLLRSNFVTLVAAVSNGSHRRPPRMAAPDSAVSPLGHRRDPRSAPYGLYLRSLDRRVPFGPDPEAPVDCSDLLAGIAIVPAIPLRSQNRDSLPEETLVYLRALDLDVVLRLGFGILSGGVLRVARHGVWSYHHGDSRYYRGGPAHLWELIEGSPVSGVVLQVLDERLDAGAVLDRALFQTAPTFSARANRFGPFWGSTHFVIRALHTLHERGPDALFAGASSAEPYRGRRAAYREPTAADLVRWLVPKRARNVMRRLFKRAVTTRWRVAWRRSASPLLPQPSAAALADFRWVANPTGRYLADPFMATTPNGAWLFVEDFDIATDKGVIAAAEIDNGGRVGKFRTVLERPYHLSYPHVFAHDGEMFMVPESLQSGAVELYRARRFPDDWVLEARLMDLRAVDATLFERDGRFWMFASPMPVLGHAPSTLLFSAPAITGPWTLHPASPVTSDVRAARSAGAVFLHAGRWYRPAQDCAPIYGRALVLHEIEALDLERYAERPVATLEPAWLPGLVGVHTYNRAGDWEVIDGNFEIALNEVDR